MQIRACGFWLLVLGFIILTQTAWGDLVVFKDNVLINNTRLLAVKHGKIHLRWHDQNFSVSDTRIEKVVGQATLDANTDILDQYMHSSEFIFPESFTELKGLVELGEVQAQPGQITSDETPANESESGEIPAHGAILFKNKIVIENADVVSRNGKMISVSWQGETYSLHEKYFEQVLDVETLTKSPQLLEGYRETGEYVYPQNFSKLKRFLTTGPVTITEEDETYQSEGPDSGQIHLGRRFGIFGNLGYAATAMGDVNQYEIDAINSAMAAQHITGSLSDITGGVTLDGGWQYGINDNFLIGMDLQYQWIQTQTTFKNTRAPYDSLDLEYTFPLSSVGFFIKGMEPLSNRFFLTAGGGVDYHYAYGTLSAHDTLGNSIYDTLSSSGFGFKLMGGAQVFFSPYVGLGLDVGYRYAVLDNLVTSDGTVLKVGNPRRNMRLDYSGAFFRIGLNVFFGGARYDQVILRPQENQNIPTAVTPAEETHQTPPIKAQNKSLAEKLRELKKMTDEGLLTKEEYKDRKKKMLDAYTEEK
jgi:hypothetical protein